MLLTAILAVFAFSGAAHAADVYWNVVSGKWEVGANWDGGLVPVAGDSPYINNGGTALIDAISADGLQWLVVGNAGGTGILNLTNGGKATFADTIYLGHTGLNSKGTVTVDGAGSELKNNAGYLVVGNFGTGWLALTNGGLATSAGQIRIGNEGTGKGAVTVDGAGSQLSTSYLLYIGNNGTGTLALTGGGTAMSASSIRIGGGGTGKGTVTVDGKDGAGVASELKNTDGSLIVGSYGTGFLSLTNGGKATSANDINIGHWGGSSGTVMVGAGSTLSGTNIYVGGSPVGIGGKGWLGGAGTVVANGGGGTVRVYSTGTLAAGDRASATRGTMTITGKLVMEDLSTLHINHYGAGAGNNDLVSVTGEVTFGANLNVSVASLANLGDLSAKPLVSTLSTTGATTPTGNLQLNGLDLSGSRAAGSSIALGKDLNNLYVSGATPFNADNTLVYWTGAAGNEWWDLASDNWTDYGSITKFLDGDQVTFNMTVANTVIDIQGSGKTVAQMGVTADYDLTINGNIYGDGSAAYTTLNNMSGGLNKVGMGTLTANTVQLSECDQADNPGQA